ncbi:unnamed protein product [Phytophthora fragariaefolia]|uniref:Unnamed protein product n=1 Tax=Phytophthora fragariaefolia TaxID=1490495 RepID=A0A9W7CZZ9_9STRA|nr:unnamed protein product [Phytophthora fragariaefolia]
MATSDYLRHRMALENRDAAWIAELRPKRRVLGIAQDVTAVAIPPSMMSSRECAAVLETILFEAGFEFVNVVPDWFMTQASKINPGYVRSVVEEVQQLLTIELIEWKQLTAGVSFKVVPASDTKPVFKEEKTQDAQAVKDDLLMDDYEVERLGPAFVSQCQMAGILALRSPRGSPENEPNPKRPQYRPAGPLSVSTPSVHSLVPSTDVSLNADARAMSVQGSTLNTSSSGISDSVPSMIGPSGTSNDSVYATSFHTQTSRDSSSSSSLMSLGHSASTHKAGGALAAAPDMGMFVTKTVIPARRMLPDQVDVDMAEVASAETRSSRTASRRRSSKAKTAVKQEKPEPAPSESGLTSEGLQQSSRSSRRDRSVRTRSSRTSQSLRSGSRSSSASSGAAHVALNVMRQLQEQQAAFQTQLSRAQLDMRLEVQRELQNASFEVRSMKEELSRAQAEKAFAERAFAQAEAARVEAERGSREAEWYPEVPAYSGPVEPVDYAAVHEDHLMCAPSDIAEVPTKLAKQQYEADREDLERRWKERLNAAEAKLQRAEAERARTEAERARRAEEADGEMRKRLDSVQQTIQNVLLERERERAEPELERDTALNRQKFLADQNRELRATLSQVQAFRTTTAPHPATGIKAETSAVPQSKKKSTTLNQVSSGAINDGVAPGTGYVHSKNTTEVGAAQLRATVGTSLPKKETAGSSQGTKTVTTSKSSASKSESAAKGSASSAAKKSASRRSSSRRGSKEDADPPSSDPDDSDSSSSDSSDDDSSSTAPCRRRAG